MVKKILRADGRIFKKNLSFNILIQFKNLFINLEIYLAIEKFIY